MGIILKKTGVGISLLMLTFSLSLMFDVQPAKAVDFVYINADGSVDPPSAPILNVGNSSYTFTADIYATWGLFVERDNILVDGAGHVLEGGGSGSGIHLSARSGVTIRGVTIRKSYWGIALYGSSGNTISANTITNSNHDGIYLSNSSNNNINGNTITNSAAGITLDYSSFNSISGNTFTDDGLVVRMGSFSNSVNNNTVNGKPLVYLEGVADYSVENAGQVVLVRCNRIRVEGLTLSRATIAVELWETTSSIVSGNTITASSGGGISLYSSSGNTISADTIIDNGFGSFDIAFGIWLGSSSNNIISGNNITNNDEVGIFLESSTDNSINENNVMNNLAGIVLGSSSGNSISRNSIANNSYGIGLDSSSNNNISKNNVANSYEGIGLVLSSNHNTISGNNITNNGNHGVWLNESSNNLIFHNNFVGNAVQAVATAGFVNVWDDGYPSGGNYWSDYNGTDADQDGIGDTPYIISSNNEDNYPFIEPFTPTVFVNITVGLNVTVHPTSDLRLTFSSVTASGYVRTEKTSAVEAPLLVNLVGQYYDIDVTARYSGNITISLAYDDSDMGLDRENSLQMTQYTPLQGDVVNYGQVNILDISFVAKCFGTKPGDVRWNATADITGDGSINILDVSSCAKNFGKTTKWTNITTYVDTELNIVHGETTHFSFIGIH